MQTFNKFHLECPLITDEIVAKATLILTMIGHKMDETGWEIESYQRAIESEKFIRSPRVRCKVPNCNDIFGLIQSKFLPIVSLVRFYYPDGSRKLSFANLLVVPGSTTPLDELRATVQTYKDFSNDEMNRAYCVRYRNLR